MIELNFTVIISIFIVGIFVGYINTLSGSGSLISLPVLIFFGLDANIANGTNRISILFQTLTGVLTFKKENLLDLRMCFILAIPVILGSIPGAYLGAIMDKELLEKVLGFIFLILIIIILIRPGRWNKNITEEEAKKKISIKEFLIFFLIGVYGGFIQAGVGIFMIYALVSIMGYDLVRANAVKLFLTLIFTPFALIIFIQQSQVNFTIGLILAFGSMIGAYFAAKTAIKTGAKFIKWLVITMILFSAIQFMFFR